MKKYIVIILLIILITVVVFRINKIYEEEGIKVNIATAFYPTFEKYFTEEDNVYLKLSSTQKCYEEIITGKCDIAIVTEPSEEQLLNIKESNKDLEFISIAKEPLIFFVNKSNSVDNLTIENIQDIYLGKIKNWNEVDVNDIKINTYQLEKNNGSHTSFEKIVDSKNIELNNNHFEVKYMDDIIRKVNQDENGIAYAFNSYYNNFTEKDNLKKILINGIELNEENIEENRYELMYDVYFVYDKKLNEENDEVLKLLNKFL